MGFKRLSCLLTLSVALALGATTVRLDESLLAAGFAKAESMVSKRHKLHDASRDEYQFSHHPSIQVIRDRLFVVWSSGLKSEDFNGQRVMLAASLDGVEWDNPSVLVPDPDGEGPYCAVASGCYDNGRSIIAYYSSMVGGLPRRNPRISDVWAIESLDARTWGAPRKITPGFIIEAPRPLPSGRLLMNGENPDYSTCLLVSDDGKGVTGWRRAKIPPFPDFESQHPEPAWFTRKDGTVVMLFRARREVPWLYVSMSADQGMNYLAPVRTNFPSATSRMSAGNLPDGRAYCIWNPVPRSDRSRNPLVLALSGDGRLFDKAYVIRGEPTTQQVVGEHKSDGWQYPSAVAWRDSLWIVYSVNKEDIEVCKIELKDLR